jgi:hypothetical protein
MAGYRFHHHYTLAEARSLLPQAGRWLTEIRLLRQRLQRQDERLAELQHDHGDQGGERVEEWVRNLARLRDLMGEFSRREIQIQDLERGLIDFPSLRGSREVFLCWEEGEEDIEHWHELSTGFAGREKL